MCSLFKGVCVEFLLKSCEDVRFSFVTKSGFFKGNMSIGSFKNEYHSQIFLPVS